MKYGFIENAAASRGELPLTVYIHIVPAYRLDDENVVVLLTILKAEGGNIKMNFRLIGQPIGVELKFALSQSHPFFSSADGDGNHDRMPGATFSQPNHAGKKAFLWLFV